MVVIDLIILFYWVVFFYGGKKDGLNYVGKCLRNFILVIFIIVIFKYCIICESLVIWRKDIGLYKVFLMLWCWYNLVGGIF